MYKKKDGNNKKQTLQFLFILYLSLPISKLKFVKKISVIFAA